MTEPEAPDGYVTFVARHLATLRTESDRLTGDRGVGDEIYSDVLSAVAARWRWLELLRTRLHRTAVADVYLRRTLVARAKRWRDEQLYPVEVSAAPPRPHWAARIDAVAVPAERWDAAPRDLDRRRRWRRRPDGPPEARPVDVSAVSAPPIVPAEPPLVPAAPWPARGAVPWPAPGAAPGAAPWPAPGAAPWPAPSGRHHDAGPTARWRTGGRVSLGLRQAAFLSPEHRAPAPIAEAAIAWWHAYEATRRRRRVGLAAGLVLLFTALTQIAMRH
jgi:hypothetical protein